MIALISMAIFLAMLGITYMGSLSRHTVIRIILVPMGMIGMISSAIIFFLTILILMI